MELRTRGLFAFVLLIFTDSILAAQESESSLDRQVETLLIRTVESNRLPGMVAAIIEGDEVIAVAAAGVRKWENHAKLETSDKVHIGSCTKSITGTLIGILVDEGKIKWTDTIGEVLPDLRGKIHNDYLDVTVKQLMAHRGGFPANAKNWWRQDGANIVERRHLILVNELAADPKIKPGAKYVYSNLGVMAAGHMAEKVTGRSWENLVKQKIFKPLGIKSAGFGAPGSDRDVTQPWGHKHSLQKDGNGQNVVLSSQADNAPALGPAGTVHLNIEDWARFLSSHLSADSKYCLVKPETLTNLHHPALGETYVAGFNAVQRRWGGNVLNHAGSNTTWHSNFWIAPEKNFAVVTATNIAFDGTGKIVDQVTGELIRIYLSGKKRR